MPRKVDYHKKNFSQLDDETATRQARNSRDCPETEGNKKTLSQLDNGTATRKLEINEKVPISSGHTAFLVFT